MPRKIDLYRVLVVLGFIAYTIPWVSNPGAALTLNAYDLAEWTSLHPAVRGATPPLFVTFCLRLIPLLLVTLMVLEPAATWLGRIALPWLIAVALLPPLEFFSGNFNDINYRQQFLLSILAVVVGGLGFIRLENRWPVAVSALVSLSGAIITLLALNVGGNLMQEINLTTSVGVGGLVMCLIFSIWGVTKIREATYIKSPRHTGLITENQKP